MFGFSHLSGKLLLVMALLLLPLQGIAASLSVLTCHGDAQAHAAHAGESHHHDNSGHGGPHGDDAGSGSAAFHLCCNLTVSVPPSLTVAMMPADVPVRAMAPVVLHDLFLPDQPQRPPLA